MPPPTFREFSFLSILFSPYFSVVRKAFIFSRNRLTSLFPTFGKSLPPNHQRSTTPTPEGRVFFSQFLKAILLSFTFFLF